MYNFPKPSGNNNNGLLIKFWYVHVRYVTYMPEDISSVVIDDIVLADGIKWNEGYSSFGRLEFNQTEKDTPGGTIYNQKLAGMCPNDIPAITDIFRQLKYDNRYLVIHKDSNGEYKLSGSVKEPMRFNYELIKPAEFQKYKGYSFTFSNPCRQPSLHYLGKINTDSGTLDNSAIWKYIFRKLSFSELNTYITSEQRQELYCLHPLKTGVTTSYTTGDDGYYKHGRLASFSVLSSPNPFGNTDRFTDIFGTQVYAQDYMIDWATGLGWKRTGMPAAVGFNATVAQAEAYSMVVNGKTYNDFYLPNINELLSVRDWRESIGFTKFLGIIGQTIPSATTSPNDSLLSLYCSSQGRVLTFEKLTLTMVTLICRIHV